MQWLPWCTRCRASHGSACSQSLYPPPGFDLCEVGQEEVILKTGKQASRRAMHFALQALLALFGESLPGAGTVGEQCMGVCWCMHGQPGPALPRGAWCADAACEESGVGQ